MSIIDEKNSPWQGDLTFTYTINDAAGNASRGTVTIPAPNIPNTSPVATDDIATVIAGSSVVIDVLVNDSDPEGDALSVTTANAVSGSVVINADNTLTYTASARFTGSDTVSYTISDPAGNTNTGQVVITVDMPLTLSIDTTASVGDFSIEANAGEITLSIIEPVEYADAYTFVTTDLQEGPVNLAAPRVSGNFAIGQTLTGIHGLWAGMETDGAITFEYQWFSGTTEIPAATSDSYTVQSSDIVSGVSFVVRAINTAASRTESVKIAPTVSTAWAPTDDASVVGWYDFSDNSSLTLDSKGLIQEAADKSGAGYTASQSTTSARASLTTINGLQAADFSAGAGLQIANGWQPAGQNSVVLTVVGDTIASGEPLICRSDEDIQFSIRWGGGTRNMQYVHSDAREGKWVRDLAEGPAIVGGYRFGSSSYTGAAGEYSSPQSVGTTATLDDWNIGSSDGAGTSAYTQPIGEIIVALNSSDVVATRQKIEGYLAHKWGLTDSLDADHPYKFAHPRF